MLKQTIMRVLVAGSGITAAATAAALRQHLPESAQITIWEKLPSAGGRMSTTRKPGDDTSTVDLGAQYFTLLAEYKEKRQKLFDDLVEAEVFRPFQGVLEGDNSVNCHHYVTPDGSESLVNHFLSKADCEPKYNHHISKVDYDHQNGQVVRVTTKSGNIEEFDAVVLTMPVPQILQLQGTIRNRIAQNTSIETKLKGVAYSSRFCLGLFYNRGTEFPYEWDAKYFFDGPCIRFVSLDNRKRGRPDYPPSVLVHTSVPFSLEHLEKDKEEMRPTILQHLRDILPDLPEPDVIKSHKWRYSQVFKSYPGAPGCVVLDNKPLVILTGDAFAKKAFFCGAMDCAEATVESITESIMADT